MSFMVMSAVCSVPPILSLPRQKVENLPSWALGPVTITPMSSFATGNYRSLYLSYSLNEPIILWVINLEAQSYS